MLKRKITKAFAILAISIMLLIGLSIDEYATFKSPNNEHSLTIYRVPLLFSSIGGGSDALGVIILKNKNHFPVKIGKVGMVQSISAPRWNKETVDMKLILNWKLK